MARWVDLAVARNGEVDEADAARELIRDRERWLKRSQSRFENRSVLNSWGGESGTSRLSFRWAQANGHLRDLANAV